MQQKNQAKRSFLRRTGAVLNFTFNPLRRGPLAIRQDLLNIEEGLTKTDQLNPGIDTFFSVDEKGQEVRDYQINHYWFEDDVTKELHSRVSAVNRLRFLVRVCLILLSVIFGFFVLFLFLSLREPNFLHVAELVVTATVFLMHYIFAARYAFLADGLIHDKFYANVPRFLLSKGFFSFVEMDRVTGPEVAAKCWPDIPHDVLAQVFGWGESELKVWRKFSKAPEMS